MEYVTTVPAPEAYVGLLTNDNTRDDGPKDDSTNDGNAHSAYAVSTSEQHDSHAKSICSPITLYK